MDKHNVDSGPRSPAGPLAVFIVARYLPPHVGGVERQLGLLAGALVEDGAQVEAWSTTSGPTMPAGVTTHTAPRWARRPAAYVTWLAASVVAARLRRRRSATVCVAARVSAESAALSLLSTPLRLTTVVFLTGGDRRGSEFSGQRRGWVRRVLLSRAGAVVAHTRADCEEVRAAGLRGPARVIPTIVPATAGGCPWPRPPDDGLAGPTLVWCGRDDPVKDLPALARLVDGALGAGGCAPLLVICDRPPSVEFPPGTVVHVGCASPRAHMSDRDVFVLTSLYEGQSNALAEAAMEGVPTVAYATGGTNEVVSALDGGEAVAADAPDRAFADAVTRVATRFADPLQREGLRRRARALFCQEPARLWLDVVQSVAGRAWEGEA